MIYAGRTTSAAAVVSARSCTRVATASAWAAEPYTVGPEFRRRTASRAWINRLRVESAVVDDRFSCGSAREPESASII
jgi:hypothetical protein